MTKSHHKDTDTGTDAGTGTGTDPDAGTVTDAATAAAPCRCPTQPFPKRACPLCEVLAGSKKATCLGGQAAFFHALGEVQRVLAQVRASDVARKLANLLA